MPSTPWTSRFAIWLAACALLLKAAVPMLATLSAELQGKALVEVCTVYGVETVSLENGQPLPSDGLGHHETHCALTALLALPTPEPATGSVLAFPASAPQRFAVPDESVPCGRDACAAWMAGLKHGPPAFA